MSYWLMHATEVHLNILYKEILKVLNASSLLHAGESPFEVIRNGRSFRAKSHM